MATCPLCGRKGLFLRTGKHGLCEKCEYEMSSLMIQRVPILDESTKIINSTNNFETALSRIDFQLQVLEEIKNFSCDKIDPFALMGLGWNLAYLYDSAVDLSNRAHDFMDTIFQLIQAHIEKNGPSPLKDFVKIFEERPDVWIDQYDIEKSIRSILENHSKNYSISREKRGNKYYYSLDK